mmetsp:Transcript_22645/g.29573  ORF Transcript_22645/g.29573 Transcript_22645/m.29573 type:complete len:105 (+) Transcript_22645:243-557(+)
MVCSLILLGLAINQLCLNLVLRRYSNLNTQAIKQQHLTDDISQVLPGLEAGIKTMSRGQVAKIEIPPEAAYGSNGYPPIIPPNAILFFEVELISFANVEESRES